ncbi:TKDP1, partial [Cervus elaphus hippelaphus]
MLYDLRLVVYRPHLNSQVMISRIQFDNHTLEELPKLSIEYSTISEDNTEFLTEEDSTSRGFWQGNILLEPVILMPCVLRQVICSPHLNSQVMISRIQFNNHTLEELPKLSIEYSTLRAQVSPGGRGVMKAGHCTQKLSAFIDIFRVPDRREEYIKWVLTGKYLVQTLSPSCHVSSG